MPVMIGIRVMVQSLFRFSGFLVLMSECWQCGVWTAWLGCFDWEVDFTVLAALEMGSGFMLNKRKACIVYHKECWAVWYST